MDYRIFHPILDTYAAPVLLALFALLLFLQYRRPLRRWVKGVRRRFLANAGVAVPTFAVLRLVLIPAEVAVAYWAARHEVGLLHLLSLPAWLHGVLAFLLLDYLLYVWHWLNHRVPFLWRFHNVHHTDLDLGVTTAFRFHFGEMLLSAIFRVAGVLLVGAGPVAVLVYEVAFEASVAFHHSNWRLPYRLERPLSWLIVTPRMHGIHHSIVRRETDSNYSNLFTVWDRLHRTIRLNVRQDEVTVGVPGYQEDDHDHTLLGLLTLPFRRQKEYWTLPDGTQPDRPDEGDRDRLAP
jgi:sterol desaturase/sphingolipid hydroxylase (fatty acid hydroxylase superfamily)